MLVNFYVLGLILKVKFTSIHLPREIGLNLSQPVHMDRSFSGLLFSKIKRLDWKKDRTMVQSSPVAVFLQSQNRNSNTKCFTSLSWPI